MRLTQCPKKHFFDVTKYDSCPYCTAILEKAAQGAAEPEPQNNIQPVIVRLSTRELFSGCYPTTKLGRSSTKADVAFTSAPTISSHHADIFIEEEHCYIKDRNSANGTYVNGEKLPKNGQVEILGYAEIGLSKAEVFFLAFDQYAQYLRKELCLRSLVSEHTKEILYLFEQEMTLGRSFPWKLGAMSDPQIGRNHALIRTADYQCRIIDQSANGTYINEQRIPSQREIQLNDGDRIRMGNEVFIFNQQDLLDRSL